MQPDPQRQQDFTPALECSRSPVASVREQVTADEAAYAQARRVAVLAVIEALFDEVFCVTEDEWCRGIARALGMFKQWHPKPAFDEVWTRLLEATPPPDDWLPPNKRVRDTIAQRGYIYGDTQRGRRDGDEHALRFMYRAMKREYGD